MKPKKFDEAQARRESFRIRTFEIARRASARFLDQLTLPDGSWLLVFWTDKQILVKIDDDGCYHYTQGGAKWEDMERDFGIDMPRPGGM